MKIIQENITASFRVPFWQTSLILNAFSPNFTTLPLFFLMVLCKDELNIEKLKVS